MASSNSGREKPTAFPLIVRVAKEFLMGTRIVRSESQQRSLWDIWEDFPAGNSAGMRNFALYLGSHGQRTCSTKFFFEKASN